MSQANEVVSGLPDHPDLPLKPPLVFLFTIAVGVLIHHFWPRSARPDGWAAAGIALVVLAVLLVTWSAWTFKRHQTEVVPWKPTRVIVDAGPYAFSRNPIYVAFALIQMGLGLWADKLAVVLMVIPALAATSVLIIAKEEEYLERKFGDVYREYMGRVRRWM